MDKPLPSMRSLKNAWDTCRRARSAYHVETEFLVQALLHAIANGTARAPTTLQEGAEDAHLQTAQLFVALQVRLTREPSCLDGIPSGWLDQLLAGLPKSWTHALQARLLRPESDVPVPRPAERIARRMQPRPIVALAEMEAMGRA
jgi:hypothetical protein